MASSAGLQLVAGRVPGELIGRTVETSDSSTFTTTETVLISLTVPLVSGRTYTVEGKVRMNSTAAAISEGCLVRIREDNSTGNEIDRVIVTCLATASTFGHGGHLQAQFVASSTANKTFVVTGVRASAATGTQRMEGSGASPNILQVRYEEG